MANLVELYKSESLGQPQYVIYYQEDNGEPVKVLLPRGKWNRDVIIDSLVRSKYSQDEVEAIINNELLNISDFMDELRNGGITKAISYLKNLVEDEGYKNLQDWRRACKTLADKALAKYPAI